MANIYDDPAAVQVKITHINNTSSDLSTNLNKCQIGIETDTGLLGYKDDSGTYKRSAPRSTLTSGQLTKCSNATTGLLTDATNTDAEVDAAVTASHARSHSIISTSDHTSSATNGTILKANANGLPVNSIITESGTVINIAGSLTVANGFTLTTTRVTTTPYNILVTDHIIFVDTDGGAITVNLPAGTAGKNYRIINCGSAGYAVTVAPNGAELLFGSNASNLLYDGEDENIVYQTTEGWW